MYWIDPKTLLKFLHFVYDSFLHHRGLENAKSLTFTSLFAVVPLVTLTLAILSAFPSFQVFGSEVQDMIFQRLIPSSTTELQGYIATFTTQARNITWAGAVVFMVTSYLMLVNIERNFNNIWGVGELRQGLSSFLLYWSVLSLGPLLLGVGFAISSYVASLQVFEAVTQVSASVGVSFLFLQVFPIVLTALGFTLLYVAVPNCGVRLIHGLAGGVVVALAFIVVKNIFTWFISAASYQLVYGTFAAVPIFLLWIYVCWVLILVGANLVRAIPLFRAQQESYEVHPTLLMLALLHKFWVNHQRGETLKIRDLVDERWPFRDIQIEEYLELLGRKRIIRACTQDEYVLVRDLKTIQLWEVLTGLPWPPPRGEDLDKTIPAVLTDNLPDYQGIQQHFREIEQSLKEQFSENVDGYFRRFPVPDLHKQDVLTPPQREQEPAA